MMAKIYAIVINPKGRSIPVAALEITINQAKDWAKFHPNIWLIATNQDSEYWYNYIKPILNPADDLMIFGANLLDMRGWVSNLIIDWLKRDHDNRPGI